MYSSGWGKKLTYVVACSRNDVVDVSARYVAKYPEMLARRTLVNEVWLAKCIDVLDLTARLRDAKKEGTNLHDWSMQASRRKREATSLEDRRNGGDGLLKASSNAHATGERKENQLTEAERRGRTTGSVEWRAARGELGRTADAKTRALNVKCTTDLSGPVSPNVTATATATVSPDKKRAKHESMSPMSPQQRMQARVKEVFESLVQEGKSPNEAACLALQVVREENNSSKKE
jgi:hypothetical protein